MAKQAIWVTLPCRVATQSRDYDCHATAFLKPSPGRAPEYGRHRRPVGSVVEFLQEGGYEVVFEEQTAAHLACSQTAA
jgi:hypothetical protein